MKLGQWLGAKPIGRPDYPWTIDTPMDEIIGEAIGAASTCWEHPERAGAFDVETATALVEAVLRILHAKSIGLEP